MGFVRADAFGNRRSAPETVVSQGFLGNMGDAQRARSIDVMRNSNLIVTCMVGAAIAVMPSTSWSDPSETEEKNYVAADADNDEHLNRAEFEQFVRLMADAGNSKAKRIRFFRAYGYAFGIADANGDGLIAPDELIEADANN